MSNCILLTDLAALPEPGPRAAALILAGDLQNLQGHPQSAGSCPRWWQCQVRRGPELAGGRLEGMGHQAGRHSPLPRNPITEGDLELPASQTARVEAPWEGGQRSAATEGHTGALNFGWGCRKQHLRGPPSAGHGPQAAGCPLPRPLPLHSTLAQAVLADSSLHGPGPWSPSCPLGVTVSLQSQAQASAKEQRGVCSCRPEWQA